VPTPCADLYAVFWFNVLEKWAQNETPSHSVDKAFECMAESPRPHHTS
jgi:hypothetical protein